MTHPFNAEPLEAAIAQLREGLAQAARTPDDALARDGVIQRFEYTVDLAWKLLQRYLHNIARVEESRLRTKNDLFRAGAQLGLIADADAWIAHYEARNSTSHGYGAATAIRVYERAPMALEDAQALLEALRDATRPAA